MWGRLAGRLRAPGRGPRIGPIGLDLSHDWIHLAQWERRDDRLQVLAVTSRLRERGDSEPAQAILELRELLTPMRREQPFQRATVVASVPSDEVRLMVLNYRAPDQQDEDAHIARLAEERLQEPLANYVIDFVPMRTSGEKHGEKSALLAATPRERILEYLTLLQGAGLQVEAIEIEPVAIRRIVNLLAEDERRENSLIVHCGAEKTHVTVLWGRRLVLYRELEFGESQLVEQISETLNVAKEEARMMLRRYGLRNDKVSPLAPDEDTTAEDISWALTEVLRSSLYTLVDQLNRALVYAASQTHGAQIHHVLLGGMARWPGCSPVLQELMGTPIQALDPVSVLGLDQMRTEGGELEPDPAVALGLALRGMR